VEGGGEMSDIVLGMIIGGAIGVLGSAAVALIQGYYSLKGHREENSSHEQQQSIQIQYEKDGEVLSRRIVVRSRYLEPLSSHLCGLHSAIENYRNKLIEVMTSYYVDGTYEIRVPKVARKEFVGGIKGIQSTLTQIFDARNKMVKATAQIADMKLLEAITVLTDKLVAFYKATDEMYRSLCDSMTERDLVYDSEPVMKKMSEAKISTSRVLHRIESLLSGVDEDNE